MVNEETKEVLVVQDKGRRVRAFQCGFWGVIKFSSRPTYKSTPFEKSLNYRNVQKIFVRPVISSF